MHEAVATRDGLMCSWQDGEPPNAEPHKCARIDWFPMNRLPDNIVPYSRAGVELYR